MQFGLESKATMLNRLLSEYLFLVMSNKSITKLNITVIINMDKKQKEIGINSLDLHNPA